MTANLSVNRIKTHIKSATGVLSYNALYLTLLGPWWSFAPPPSASPGAAPLLWPWLAPAPGGPSGLFSINQTGDAATIRLMTHDTIQHPQDP